LISFPVGTFPFVSAQNSVRLQDLNDLYYFVAVVDHGGLAAAGRAPGLQKSKLIRCRQESRHADPAPFQKRILLCTANAVAGPYQRRGDGRQCK
jgi:hypothetical protein